MADIVVLGGCIIDLISYAKRFPKPGETMAGNQFSKGFGGKAANQCVMAKRLGASVALIAKLGNDTFGHEYIKDIKDGNINSDHVTMTNESHTSTAAICVTDDGQNSIVYVPGAIEKLAPQDVKNAEQMIASSKLLLCSYECPLDTLLEALTIAKKHKVMTLVNAAPSPSTSYEVTYPLTDIICFNEVEAEEAVGFPVQSIDDAGLAVKTLIKNRCSAVIITLGSKGAVFQNKELQNLIHIPARPVKPVDSTGAGDAFMGSLAYFLSEHPKLTFQEMIRRSCEIATISVLERGTQSSFPYRKDVSESLLTEV